MAGSSTLVCAECWGCRCQLANRHARRLAHMSDLCSTPLSRHVPADTWRWLQDRMFDELNTLSVVYRAPATTVIDAEQGAGGRMCLPPAAREPFTVGLVAPPAGCGCRFRLPSLRLHVPLYRASGSPCTQRFDLAVPSSHPTTFPC